MQKLLFATGTLILAGCANTAPEPVKVEKPKTLVAGEYEVTAKVTKLASTDKTTPATKLKLGDTSTLRACVAADGTPDPAMFAEAGDVCSVVNSYSRSGRLSVQYSCKRGSKGEVYPQADGNYTADGYKAVVVSSTSLSGDGDYALTRMLTAKRVGDCPAGVPANG